MIRLRGFLGLSAAAILLLVACQNLSSPPELGQIGTATPTSTGPALRSITATMPAKTSAAPTSTLAATTGPAVALEAVVSPTSVPSLTVTTPPSTPTILPTETPQPSATPLIPTAVLTATGIISATHTPESAVQDTLSGASITVNGVPVNDIVIMPEAVRENVRTIFARGQEMGRNPRAFSKLGDSVTLTDHYLTRFDSGHYDLGPYAHLQPAIDHYAGSFSRYGVATKIGLHAWSIFDPLWADKEWCLPDENIAACEIRLHNPSVLLIKIGSNDSGAGSYFEENLRELLDFTIENGVIPIIGTKADRFEGPDDRNNRIMRELAAEYAIPLWDYDHVSATLPRRGLSGDDVHMTMADADDYTKPETFERGYPVSDLTALMTLYEVMREVTAAGDP